MTQIDEQILALIREAVDLEINGEKFYKRAAAVTENRDGKAMFERLSKEEAGHTDELGCIFAPIVGNEGWKVIVEEVKAKGGRSGLVDELDEAVRKRKKGELAGDSDALRIAMDMERRAIANFENLIQRTKDPKVREYAEKLADEERFHYDLLQSQMDSVENMGVWVDMGDFTPNMENA